MVGEDRVTMSGNALRRVHVLRQVREKRITQREAGTMVRLTKRQRRRLLGRVKTAGDQGLVHRGRGKPSNRRIAEPIKTKALRLDATPYRAFGPTLAAEKLAERDGITLSDETRRRWLRAGRGLIIAHAGSVRIAPGAPARLMSRSWSTSMGRPMTGWRAAARRVS